MTATQADLQAIVFNADGLVNQLGDGVATLFALVEAIDNEGDAAAVNFIAFSMSLLIDQLRAEVDKGFHRAVDADGNLTGAAA